MRCRAGRRAAARCRRPEWWPRRCSIGGIVSGLRPLKTRKGDRMCVFMLDDADGSLEVVVFPEAFKQYGHLAENGQTGAGQGQVRARRRVGADCWRRRSRRSSSCASGWRRRWRSGCRRRRTTAPRSRGCGTCSRSTRATGAWRSTSSCSAAGPAPAGDGRRQRPDPRPAVGTAGVGGREDLRRRLGEPAMTGLSPRSGPLAQRPELRGWDL